MKVRFKEKIFVGDKEQDDWETSYGWTEEIKAQTISEILRLGNERCRDYEAKAKKLNYKIQVSCEVKI